MNTEANQNQYAFSLLIRNLIKFLMPCKVNVILIIACLLVQLSYIAMLPIGLQMIIDKSIKNNDLHLLSLIIVSMTAAYAIYCSAAISGTYWLSRTSAWILDNLRRNMVDRLHSLPADFYHTRKAADILSRFSTDIGVLENILTRALPGIFFGGVSIIVSLCLIFFVEWRLALTLLLIMPLIMILPKAISPKASRLSYELKANEAEVLGHIQENINGRMVIRQFGLEEYMRKLYLLSARNLFDRNVKTAFWSQLVGITAYMGISFLLLLIIAVGSLLSIHGYMSPGGLIASAALLINIATGSATLSQQVPILFQSMGGMQRIHNFLTETEVTEAGDRIDLTGFSEKICFHNVTFSYMGKGVNLNDVNFTVHKGQSVAFVGSSGAGKSTVSHLLLQNYSPNIGTITIDDFDIGKINPRSWQNRMAVVFQDTFLFNTTIGENIRYGKLDASHREVEAAALAAELHEWIMNLPEKYSTPVGEKGGSLSGGQRQRIAIARALLRKPDILILDEATSALDPGTEAAINATIKKLSGELTLISITHRLESVRDMDRIFVMDQGNIVESGSHQDLLGAEGLYSRLWRKQSGFTFNDDAQGFEITPQRLADIPFFNEVDQECLEELAGQFTTEFFRQGHQILVQGEQGTRFHIIVRGSAELKKKDCSGQAHDIGVITIGDYFGEIALVKNCSVTATVIARVDMICLTLSKDHFLRFLNKFPELKKAVEHIAGERMQKTDSVAGFGQA